MSGLIKWLLSSIALIAVQLAEANPVIVERIDKALVQAKKEELTYLPQYIVNQKQVCLVYNGQDQDNCFIELTLHSEEVLACKSSLKRYQEGIQYDQWLANETFLQNPQAVIPGDVQFMFDRLAKVAKKKLNTKFPIEFKLAAYKSLHKNAHAAVNGQIYLSSGLWEGKNPLTTVEIAAVIGHELGHVLELHGVALNCLALEWVSPNLTIQEAQGAFNEDLRGSTRFDVWSALSQKLEFSADLIAINLLKAAGLDPNSMAYALEKMVQKEKGFSSGSHPEFVVRIQAALKAAQ